MRLPYIKDLRLRRRTAAVWMFALGAAATVLLTDASMAAVPVKVVDSGAGVGASPDLAFNANSETVVVYHHTTQHALKLVRTGCATSQVLTVDGGSGNGTSTFTATLTSYSHVTTLTYVAGQIDWAASSAEISLSGTLDGPLAYGVAMTAKATFDNAGVTGPLPENYPAWGGTATSGQWGGTSDAVLSISGPVVTSQPLAGRWSEGFESGEPDTIGNVIHAASWDSQALGTEWEVTGAALGTVSPVEDTVDESGNGKKVYQRTYIGGRLVLNGGLWSDRDTWPSLALDAAQAAHISRTRGPSSLLYTDAPFVGGPDPTTTMIPGISGASVPVLAMDSVNRPYIAYYAMAKPWLARFDISSGSWQTEIIPGPSTVPPPDQSCPVSIRVNSRNEPIVAYVSSNPSQIVLATRTADGWVLRYHAVVPSPANVSLALDLDVPHVACVAGGEVRVYRFHTIGVSEETAVVGPMILSPHSLGIDTAGRMRIAYWDPTTGAYYVALKDYGWLKTLIEQVPASSPRPTCSLAIDPQNRWAMAYVDGAGRLKLAGPGVLSPVTGDADCDGIPDPIDNCPEWANPLQEDFDRDGVGDVCDNCVSIPNHDQADSDHDGIGDCCDSHTPDMDRDGYRDSCDNCPGKFNPDQLDADGDGVGDLCDMCPNTIPQLPVDKNGCPPVVPPDFDRDGDVDPDDFALFESCASGPEIPLEAGCEGKDLDADGDVDQTDFSILQRCHSGENVPADVSCAN